MSAEHLPGVSWRSTGRSKSLSVRKAPEKRLLRTTMKVQILKVLIRQAATPKSSTLVFSTDMAAVNAVDT